MGLSSVPRLSKQRSIAEVQALRDSFFSGIWTSVQGSMKSLRRVLPVENRTSVSSFSAMMKSGG